MHTMKEQYGGSLIIVAICLAFFGSILFLGFKLAPIYLEHFGVTSSLASLEKDRLGGKSVSQLREYLDKRLKINDVHRVSAADAKFPDQHGNRYVELAYEVQLELVGNIDLLITFNDRVMLPR